MAHHIDEFVGSTWETKFKQIFDIERSSFEKKLYDELVNAKEAFRNPNSQAVS